MLKSPVRLRPSVPRSRVVVLLSGTGTLCAALLAAAADPGYPAAVVAVGSDRGPRASSSPDPRSCRPSYALPDHPDRAAWDRALAAELAAYEPDLVVSAGFMKILGPASGGFGGRMINTHPALLPAFPGAHAVRDALAAGVPVTGATVHLVDAGVDTGPVLAQREVAVLAGDDEPHLHERIKTWSASSWCRRWRAHRRRPERGRAPDERPHPGPPGAAGRLGQDRHRGAGPGLAAAGVALVTTGATARPIADAGMPVTPVEQVTGFPECLDGRVKTLHPAVHAGHPRRPAQARARRPARRARHRAVRPGGGEPVPVQRDGGLRRRSDECVEQIDIGGPAMVRAAAKNHPSVAVVVDPARYDEV